MSSGRGARVGLCIAVVCALASAFAIGVSAKVGRRSVPDGARVSFKTANNRYICSEDAGADAQLYAECTGTSPDAWFRIYDLTNSTLNDGDQVQITTWEDPDDLYLQAAYGGDDALLAVDVDPPAEWETFTLIDLDNPDGEVADGDRIALEAYYGVYYVVAQDGGGTGSLVYVTSTSIGTNETFNLVVH